MSLPCCPRGAGRAKPQVARHYIGRCTNWTRSGRSSTTLLRRRSSPCPLNRPHRGCTASRCASWSGFLRVERGMVRYLSDNWSFDPFVIIALTLVCWHEVGLARLARKSRLERTRQRRLRSLWFYSGLAVLLMAVASPIDYWADRYFFVHMIEHLLLMFAAPVLVVAGAPWQPLLAGLPGQLGKDATRQVMTGRWSRPLRAIAGFLCRPWAAVVSFNLAMVIWHLPGPFDLGTRNETVHIWLVHGSFFITGVLFWLQFVPSVPFRIAMSRAGQAAA